MKFATKVLAVIFGVLAIILYFYSVREVNTGYGSLQVANIQATVFAAACAVMCVINLVGCFILSYLEDTWSSIYAAIKEGKRDISAIARADHHPSVEQTANVSNSRASVFSERNTANGAQWRCPKCGSWNDKSALYAICGARRPLMRF